MSETRIIYRTGHDPVTLAPIAERQEVTELAAFEPEVRTFKNGKDRKYGYKCVGRARLVRTVRP